MATNLILGCGYLGRKVAKRWLAGGNTVAALTRSRTSELRALGVDPVLGDVTSPSVFEEPLAETFDTVLYAVGMDRSSGKSMRDVYVDGLSNVLNALPTPRQFIYVSSTSVYGQADGEWVDESSETLPAEESGRILAECESLLRHRIPEAIVLRFAGIYGPGRVIRRASIEKGEIIATDPEGWLNLIHVGDGATAVLAAADRGRAGETYNVADDSPARRREYYMETATLLKAPPPRFELTTEKTNRRIRNTRIRHELGVALRFPDFRIGLRHAIGEDSHRS